MYGSWFDPKSSMLPAVISDQGRFMFSLQTAPKSELKQTETPPFQAVIAAIWSTLNGSSGHCLNGTNMVKTFGDGHGTGEE